MQLKVREENVREGGELRGEAGRGERRDGGGVGSGATGNTVLSQPTEEALTGC